VGGRFGAAVFQATLAAAQQAAINSCGAGCQVVFTSTNQCVAYADSRQGGYWFGTAQAWGTGASAQGVGQSALSSCNSRAPANSCRVEVARCR
jgi:hypothetical protein